jgi:putative tryptophan/tyrosine transport system substrate-binding protein
VASGTRRDAGFLPAQQLVASLNRPGANVTGIANLGTELAPKQSQLLRELVPNTARFGVLADPAYPAAQSTIKDLQAAVLTLGLQLVVVNARTDSDLEPAFATFSQQRVGAVLVVTSTFYTRRMEQLATLAARHALPAIFPYREFALAGGLMSYGSSLDYAYHQAGIYTGRILKGEKPTDLPVMQPTKFRPPDIAGFHDGNRFSQEYASSSSLHSQATNPIMSQARG